MFAIKRVTPNIGINGPEARVTEIDACLKQNLASDVHTYCTLWDSRLIEASCLDQANKHAARLVEDFHNASLPFYRDRRFLRTRRKMVQFQGSIWKYKCPNDTECL